MMTNQQKPGEIDTSRHEQSYELKRDDAIDIALLANVVGSELTKVDKNAIDSSFKKATNIDKQKIFSNQHTSTEPTQQIDSDIKSLNLKPVEIPAIPPANQSPVASTRPVSTIDLTPVLRKLDNLEKNMSALQSTYDTILNKLTNNTKQVTLTIDNDKSR